MRQTLIAATAGALFLTGCTVGPDFEAPQPEPPEEFVSQDVLAELNIAPEEAEELPLRWWEGFSDPLIDELVEYGLARNFEIGAAAARLRSARALIDLEDAGDEPRLTTGVDTSAQKTRIYDEGNDQSTTGSVFGFLGLVVPLDVFGRTARRVEAAEANAGAAEAELLRLVLANSSDIVREYLAIRGTQRQLELLQESVDLQEQTLSIVETRFEAGLAPELDVQRARTSVQRLYADIPPLREDLQNARNRLAVLTGAFPGMYEERFGESQEIPDYQAPFPESLPLTVLNARPDVREAEARLRETVAEIGVAEAELYPAFELSGDIRIGATGAVGAPRTDLLIGTIGGLIEQVVLDGGARRAQIEIAKAEAEAALLDYRQTLLIAVEEVETVLAGLESSRASQEALEAAVESSSRSFGQAETLYQQGLISFLDVVDAQRVLADARQELAAERTRYATLIAELFNVLGTPVDVPVREPVVLPAQR